MIDKLTLQVMTALQYHTVMDTMKLFNTTEQIEIKRIIKLLEEIDKENENEQSV